MQSINHRPTNGADNHARRDGRQCDIKKTADGGSFGQLITFCGDDRKILASSLTAYLAELADRLERGEIRLKEFYGLVH